MKGSSSSKKIPDNCITTSSLPSPIFFLNARSMCSPPACRRTARIRPRRELCARRPHAGGLRAYARGCAYLRLTAQIRLRSRAPKGAKRFSHPFAHGVSALVPIRIAPIRTTSTSGVLAVRLTASRHVPLDGVFADTDAISHMPNLNKGDHRHYILPVRSSFNNCSFL